MQKTLVAAPGGPGPTAAQDPWLDLEPIGEVRITSEHPDHPIEHAFQPAATTKGWRAATPGRQQVWLHLRSPQRIRQIHLRFEAQEARTQEFELSWSNDNGATLRSLVRQQFNFAPGGAMHEEENFRPDLMDVTDLVLTIVPDISGGPAVAALQAWQLR